MLEYFLSPAKLSGPFAPFFRRTGVVRPLRPPGYGPEISVSIRVTVAVVVVIIIIFILILLFYFVSCHC